MNTKKSRSEPEAFDYRRHADVVTSEESTTMKRLYVGNLALDITEGEVREAFSRFGTVLTVTIAGDRYTGRPRGFCYVEMEEGDAAIAGLNRTDLRGQPLTVCAARPKNPPVPSGLRALSHGS